MRLTPTRISHIFHNKRWHTVLIRLNNAEITQRIRNDDHFNGNIRSPEAWSYYLNQTVKHGIESAGTNFLIKGLDKKDWFEFLFTRGLFVPGLASVAVIWSHLSSQLTQPEFIQSFMYMYAAIYAGERTGSLAGEFFDLISRPHKHTDRFSLISGPQIDRALVLKLYSMFSGPVVKPLASKA